MGLLKRLGTLASTGIAAVAGDSRRVLNGTVELAKERLATKVHNDPAADIYQPRQLEHLRESATAILDSFSGAATASHALMPERLPPGVRLTNTVAALVANIETQHANLSGSQLDEVLARLPFPPALRPVALPIVQDSGRQYDLLREFLRTFPEKREDYAAVLVDLVRLTHLPPEKVLDGAARLAKVLDAIPDDPKVRIGLLKNLAALKPVRELLAITLNALLANGGLRQNLVEAFATPQRQQQLVAAFTEPSFVQALADQGIVVDELASYLRANGAGLGEQAWARVARTDGARR